MSCLSQAQQLRFLHHSSKTYDHVHYCLSQHSFTRESVKLSSKKNNPMMRRSVFSYSIRRRRSYILLCMLLAFSTVVSLYSSYVNTPYLKSTRFERVHLSLASTIDCAYVEPGHEWTARTCVFKNARIHDGSVILYAPEGTTGEIMFLNRQGKKGNKVVNVNAGYPPDEGTKNLDIKVKCKGDGLPGYPKEGPIDSTAVMFNPNWPENVGHYLFDDIFASFDAVASVGLNPFNVHLVKLSSCGDMYLGWMKELFKGQSQYNRCHKFYRDWTKLLVGSDIMVASTMAPGTPIGIDGPDGASMPITNRSYANEGLFFKNVVVGISRTAVRALGNRDESWMAFRREILKRLGIERYDTWDLPKGERQALLAQMQDDGEIKIIKNHPSGEGAVVVVLEKVEGKHARQILNFKNCVETIVNVDKVGTVVEMNPAGLSLRTQVLIFVLADAVFSAPGGITMFSGFLRRNALAMFPDHYDLRFGSYHLEPVWDDMHHFIYEDIPIKWEDLKFHDISIFRQMIMSQNERVRDWTDLQLDETVLRKKLLHGLSQIGPNGRDQKHFQS
eukprot:CFRG1765T1